MTARTERESKANYHVFRKQKKTFWLHQFGFPSPECEGNGHLIGSRHRKCQSCWEMLFLQPSCKMKLFCLHLKGLNNMIQSFSTSWPLTEGKGAERRGKKQHFFCLNILSVYIERGYYIFIKTDNRDGIRTAVFYCLLSPVMRIQGLVNDSVRISLWIHSKRHKADLFSWRM